MTALAFLAGVGLGYELVAFQRGAETLSRAAWRLRDHPSLGAAVPGFLAALAWHVLVQGRAR